MDEIQTMQQHLPEDLLEVNEGQEATVWNSASGKGRDARLEQVDVVGQTALVIRGRVGNNDWRSKVIETLGLTDFGTSQLSDYYNTFITVRLKPPLGLGIARSEAREISYSKLRVISQNRKWALQNRDRALELLRDESLSEVKVREAIQTDAGKTLSEFVSVNLRLPREQAVYLQALGEAIKEKYAECDGETFSSEPKDAALTLGKVLLRLVGEWTHGASVYDDGQGGERIVNHMDYVVSLLRGERKEQEEEEEDAELDYFEESAAD